MKKKRKEGKHEKQREKRNRSQSRREKRWKNLKAKGAQRE